MCVGVCAQTIVVHGAHNFALDVEFSKLTEVVREHKMAANMMLGGLFKYLTVDVGIDMSVVVVAVRESETKMFAARRADMEALAREAALKDVVEPTNTFTPTTYNSVIPSPSSHVPLLPDSTVTLLATTHVNDLAGTSGLSDNPESVASTLASRKDGRSNSAVDVPSCLRLTARMAKKSPWSKVRKIYFRGQGST